MADSVFLPGGRDARGTLDGASGDGDAAACVVACPPHPQQGGDRNDGRLRAVSDALRDCGVDCLRIDYGAWDGGRGEREDVLHAVAWADDRYDRVGLFGYSFGGAVALSAAARGAKTVAVAALAPPARVGIAREGDATAPERFGGIDVAADLAAIPASVPVGIVCGTRDDTADVGPVVAAARERGATVRTFDADHLFFGREREVASAVVADLSPTLRPEDPE